jgi:hypothetical protein
MRLAKSGFRKVFFLTWFFLVIVIIFLFSMAYILKKWDPANNVQFTNGSICLVHNKENVTILKREEEINSNIKPIYVCGNLKTTISIHLAIYWFKMGVKEPLYVNPVEEEFQQGFILSPLSTKGKYDAGKYRVEVWYGRSLLSTIYFDISP